MHLIEATDDFQILGLSKPGFPILLWEDMTSCVEVNAFLRHYLMRGAIESRNSWRVVSRALYDFFGFLEAHDLAWNDVDRGQSKPLAAAYRDYSFAICRHSRNTARLRLTYICEFYDFAMRQGWVTNLPYETEHRRIVKKGGYLSHTDATGGQVTTRSVMPRAHKDFPKFLSREQIQALLHASTNHHHLMIIRTALHTGLRREELASFPLAYVFNPYAEGTLSRNVRVTLDPNDGTGMKTKGSKRREIYISRVFMKALYHYSVHWRGERASLSDQPHRPLFLNQDGQPWAQDGKGIEAMVRKLGARVGLKTHPHILRHSYATHTLMGLQRQKGDTRIEPLVFLQRQLGHESIRTTMIYLHLVNEIADDAVLAYDEELNRVAE